MNGSEKQIYDAVLLNGTRLTTLETTQKLQHKENKKDIGRLYKWTWAITFLILSAAVTVAVTAIAG